MLQHNYLNLHEALSGPFFQLATLNGSCSLQYVNRSPFSDVEICHILTKGAFCPTPKVDYELVKQDLFQYWSLILPKMASLRLQTIEKIVLQAWWYSKLFPVVVYPPHPYLPSYKFTGGDPIKNLNKIKLRWQLLFSPSSLIQKSVRLGQI